MIVRSKTYAPRAARGKILYSQTKASPDRSTTSAGPVYVGLGRSLTLISAPAGFGKSTLLSTWLTGKRRGETRLRRRMFSAGSPWIRRITFPVRFWTYLVAAIQTGVKKRQIEKGAAPNLNLDPLLEYLQSDPPPSIPTALDELINTISASSERVLLVLDDYHVIQTPEIHEQMTYLLDHQPPNLHLVISTRADPPSPNHALAGQGATE